MPFNNSTATTGKAEPSRSVKIDTPTLEVVASRVVKVDLVGALVLEAATAAALAPGEDLEVAAVASVDEAEDSEADLEVVEGTVEEVQVDMAASKVGAGMVAHRRKLLLRRTRSPTLRQVVESAVLSSSSAMYVSTALHLISS